ncbi:tryptophan-rich sensory protein [Paenibacillus aquistagni]|uniref:TspO and MBR related proteins n=1 Tax=Paenibacillus aquistagni TaxID=1852522 RepID=A0A1X7LAB6_9BACL|nr:tryptophan-rich sensory protein [Paenibacillus aquistagni]SMG50497.1 TspO and MBR related proteins [Paenibacillus aquistagni]
MYHSFWRIINLIAVIATIAVNALANIIPFNGKTTGEISAMFPVLITPAPYTFSIWGLIYVLLIVFAIYLALPKQQDKVKLVGPLFLISCLFNMLWIVLWHYLYTQVWLSLLAMLGLLLSLILIYKRVVSIPRPSAADELCVQLPFRIYLGWVSVATIVNVSVVLYAVNWNGFGLSAELWTILILAVGTLLAWIVGGVYRDYAYVLVFVWAYIGIAVKEGQEPTVFYTALSLAALMFVYAVSIAFRPRSRTISSP